MSTLGSIDPFTPVAGLLQGITCGIGLIVVGVATLVYALTRKKGRK